MDTEVELVKAKHRLLRLQGKDLGHDFETAMRITLREFKVTRKNLENVLKDRWNLVEEYNRRG